MTHTRRGLLAALAAGGVGSAAGCLDAAGLSGGNAAGGSDGPVVDLGVSCSGVDGTVDLSGGQPPAAFDGARATPETEYAAGEIPVRGTPLHLGHDRDEIPDRDMSGGVGHDGIPSVDDPQFARAEDVRLPDCARVFGVDLAGDVRAYPQRVLVQHEITNDVVGGEPVAVTYCPLTGTAQGFYRGGVEFGVSGRLVNSNLIMWERERDVRWPQIAATAIEFGGERDPGDGERLLGQSLREFRVVWTSWERWSERYPETLVMTENTGSARNYNRDPYGSYDPPVSGHYSTDAGRQPNFPLMAHDDAESKRVVVGARTPTGAIAFDKMSLMESSVMTGSIDGTPIVAVADEGLAAGYIYANPDDHEVRRVDGGYEVAGEAASPDELPLDRVPAFDAMWFAWYAFYPDTERVGI